MTLIRKPAVAGQFYPGTRSALEHQLQTCFTEPRGPHNVPTIGKGHVPIKGYVVPHAGYIFSGAIAAHAYAHLAQNGFADTFVILGPNHTGMGSGVSVMTQGTWETPLGKVPINEALATSIATGIIDTDNTAHLYEHSIEVQLPFLQYIARDHPFDFVPLCLAMQDFETARDIGQNLSRAMKTSKKKIVIIASSDFSHAGFDYDSTPPSGVRVDVFAHQQDTLALEKIQQFDAQGLITIVYQNNITMCGYGPVAAMLIASKHQGATRAELLKYGTSYEVHPGSSCVGYGAVAIY